MMRLRSGIVALMLLVNVGHAQKSTVVTITEPGSGTLQDYFERADIVALVTVIAGDATAYDNPIYKAKVVQGFKGASAGQTIFFGRFLGTRLGWDYVLFLHAMKEPLSPISGSSPAFGTVQYANVFNEGYSSMETSYECIFDAVKQCDYGVRVCTDYVHLPTGTSVSPPMSESPPFGCRWIRKDKMLSLLQTIASAK